MSRLINSIDNNNRMPRKKEELFKTRSGDYINQLEKAIVYCSGMEHPPVGVTSLRLLGSKRQFTEGGTPPPVQTSKIVVLTV